MVDPKQEEPAVPARPRRRTPRPVVSAERSQALRQAIEHFYFAYREFTAGPDRILAERGLGRVHHRILYFVGRHPGLAVTALLTLLAVSKQALHRPLRELADAGLIDVQADPDDRRVRQLRLSRAGATLEAALTGTQMALLEDLFTAAGAPAEGGWRTVMAVLAGRALQR